MHVIEKDSLGKQIVSMVSPPFTDLGRSLPDMCFYFWYQLQGPDAGRLNVKLRAPGRSDDQLVYTMGGEQGDHWLQGRFSLPDDTTEQHRVSYYTPT